MKILISHFRFPENKAFLSNNKRPFGMQATLLEKAEICTCVTYSILSTSSYIFFLTV